MEVSPNYSYIGYCKKEADWLADSQTIAKCMLDESFKVDRPPAGYSKKFDNVLQLTFKGYRLDLSFESMTKLDQWFKALLITSGIYLRLLIEGQIFSPCPHTPSIHESGILGYSVSMASSRNCLTSVCLLSVCCGLLMHSILTYDNDRINVNLAPLYNSGLAECPWLCRPCHVVYM